MSDNPEAENGRYTVLAESLQKSDGPSILIVARHPGAANCLAPVGRLLYDKGFGVYFKTIDEGEKIINLKFKNRQDIKSDSLPHELRWTLIANDAPSDFEIRTLLEIRKLGLQPKVGIVEDYPTSINGLIQDLIDHELTPDLILTTTRDAADIYRKKYPMLKKCPIIPVGQPSFDPLLVEDTLSESRVARKKLGIAEEVKLVTYIGLPAQDVSGDEVEFKPFDDFNSYILEEVAKSMVNIASKYPQNKFGLIYRPHLREIYALWEHPELTKITDLPKNLIFISHSRTSWQQTGLTTRQICAASNLVTTVISTVGQETALSGARPQNKTRLGSLVLHILPEDALRLWLPDGFHLAEIGATGFARTVDATQGEIEKCLFDETYQKQIKEGQRNLLLAYRFKSSATARVPLWMRAVDQFGSNLM